MPKVLFLTVHRPNRSPSQRFRFEQYLNYLEENGYCYHFSYLLDEFYDRFFYKKGFFLIKLKIVLKSFFKRLKEVKSANQYDIIFIQRECFMIGSSFFEKKFAKSKAKIIYDFDDSIWLSNVSEANKKFAWLKSPHKTSEIISLAHLIIAGNEYLKRYSLNYNKNTIVIPTTIDTEEYKKKEKTMSDKVVIGWSGSITTIQHFEYSLNILKKLNIKYPNKLEFRVIGDADYVNEELGIKGLGWNKETEIDDLSQFDIGIMPLPDDEWAKGKCGLKGLQYMALEIPTVMSPVGVNTEIIQDGENGFLAATEQDWIEKLSLLIESPELREKIGKAGRKTVVEKYSVEANKQKYLEAFNSVLNM
jgi:glycosyltransferase involved in cell wall biosynthesis